MTFTGEETVALHKCALRQAYKQYSGKDTFELLGLINNWMSKIYSEAKEIGSIKKVLEKYDCEDLIKEYNITR
jgi:hypothetical protein